MAWKGKKRGGKEKDERVSVAETVAENERDENCQQAAVNLEIKAPSKVCSDCDLGLPWPCNPAPALATGTPLTKDAVPQLH